jgi:hypothetical protein
MANHPANLRGAGILDSAEFLSIKTVSLGNHRPANDHDAVLEMEDAMTFRP